MLERGQRLRELFDAACELPAAQRRAHLQTLTDDASLIDEVLALVDAQTESLGRAIGPLTELMANLPDTELQVGDAIGTWRLVERLASGGMGTVFVAERADQLYRQRVAIKLLRGTPDAASAARLAAERQILAELAHPDIARLYDGGTTPAGQPYLVMEYVDGRPLDAYLADAKPGLDARIALFLSIGRAVAFAHQHLVLHCDLKPGNILVRNDGEPVLLDFGIARLVGDVDAGGAYCTPAYASPELLRGERVGVPSDVFSLGVLLAEMLADTRLRRGLESTDLPMPSQVASDEVPWRARLRGDLDAIVAKATATAPGDRYPSVAAFADDLERWRTHRPVQARPSTVAYRSARFVRRRWREVAVGTFALTLSVGFVWRLALERDRAEEAANTAEQVSDFLIDAFDAADPRRSADSQDVTARQVLDAGVARVDDHLADSPAVRARLLLTLGRAYRNLGQSQRAQELLTQAADGFLSPAVDRPLQAADAYSQLAVELGNEHRKDEALAVARRMVALREAAGTTDPALRADSLNTLGLALEGVEDFDGANAALLEALQLRRGLGPGEDRAVASTLLNLGMLHRNADKLDDAARYYRESMAISGRLGGRARPTYQNAIDGLARVHRQQNRLDLALPLQRENLALATVLYGAESGHVGRAHNELANVLHDTARYGEAAQHYRAAMRLEGMARGTDSPAYAVTLNNLASLHEDRGDVPAAEALFRQSLRIRRAALPADDPLVRRSEQNLARLLVRRGAVDEAATLITPVLAQRRKELAADHNDRIRIELIDAERLLRAGQRDAAARALSAIATAKPDPASPLLAQRLQLAADIAEARGDWRGAIDARTRALSHLRAIGSAQQTQAARLSIDLARAELAIGQRASARRLLADAERVLRPALVPTAPAWSEWTRLRTMAGA